MTPTEIIEYLTREQTRQGISDVELLKKVKIHRSTLWRMRSGATPATLDQITAICEVLGFKLTIGKINQNK